MAGACASNSMKQQKTDHSMHRTVMLVPGIPWPLAVRKLARAVGTTATLPARSTIMVATNAASNVVFPGRSAASTKESRFPVSSATSRPGI